MEGVLQGFWNHFLEDNKNIEALCYIFSMIPGYYSLFQEFLCLSLTPGNFFHQMVSSSSTGNMHYTKIPNPMLIDYSSCYLAEMGTKLLGRFVCGNIPFYTFRCYILYELPVTVMKLGKIEAL
jgi:hypothetical protein